MYKLVSTPSVHVPKYFTKQAIRDRSLQEGKTGFALAVMKLLFPDDELPMDILKLGPIQKAYEFRRREESFYLTPEYQKFFNVWEVIKSHSDGTRIGPVDLPTLLCFHGQHPHGGQDTQWVALAHKVTEYGRYYGMFDPLEKKRGWLLIPERDNPNLVQKALQKRDTQGFRVSRIDQVTYIKKTAFPEGRLPYSVLFDSDGALPSQGLNPLPAMLAGGISCYTLAFWKVAQSLELGFSPYRLPALQASYQSRIKHAPFYLPDEFRAFLKVEETSVRQYDCSTMGEDDFNVVLSIQKQWIAEPATVKGHSIALLKCVFQGVAWYGVFDPASRRDEVEYTTDMKVIGVGLQALFDSYKQDGYQVTEVIKLSYKKQSNPLWEDTE